MSHRKGTQFPVEERHQIRVNSPVVRFFSHNFKTASAMDEKNESKLTPDVVKSHLKFGGYRLFPVG